MIYMKQQQKNVINKKGLVIKPHEYKGTYSQKKNGRLNVNYTSQPQQRRILLSRHNNGEYRLKRPKTENNDVKQDRKNSNYNETSYIPLTNGSKFILLKTDINSLPKNNNNPKK